MAGVSLLRQVRALVRLRFTIWRHQLSSTTGLTDSIVAILVSVTGAMMGLGLAIGVAVLIHRGCSGGEEMLLLTTFTICLYLLAVLAVVLPFFFIANNPGLDLSRLLQLPISRGGLYRLALGASFLSGRHLSWYPGLLALWLAGVVVPAGTRGIVMLLLGTALVMASLAVNVAWCHLLLTGLHILMRRRTAKELVAIAGLLIIIAASLVPALLEEHSGESFIERLIERDTRTDSGDYPAGSGQRSFLRLLAGNLSVWLPELCHLLPPSLAAAGLTHLHLGEQGQAALTLVWLGLWIATGIVIDRRLFTRQLLDPAGGARSRSQSSGAKVTSSARKLDLARLLPSAVAAMAVKELHYLQRAVVGKLGLLMAPVIVAFCALLLERDLDKQVLGLVPHQLVLFGMMLYASILVHNFVSNAFAWEGAGAGAYFLSPVPLHLVLLGKNTGVWIYNGVVMLLTLVTWCLLAGTPTLLTLASASLINLSAVLAVTIPGNFISVLFPVARSPSNMTNSPSQVAMLLMLGGLVANAGILGLLVGLPAVLGRAWMQPLLLLGWLLILAGLYRRLLQPAAALLDRRREPLLEALTVKE